MKLITPLFAKIRAFFGSIAQPAAPVATTTAPHIRALLLHLCNQDAEQATWVPQLATATGEQQLIASLAVGAEYFNRS